MTNSQCIEVAEKVWGWKFVDKGHDYIHIENAGDFSPKLCLKEWFDKEAFCRKQVNSWEGFGRTVEAMDEKKYVFRGDGVDGLYFYLQKDVGLYKFHYGGHPTNLIEATHLAALEALK